MKSEREVVREVVVSESLVEFIHKYIEIRGGYSIGALRDALNHTHDPVTDRLPTVPGEQGVDYGQACAKARDEWFGSDHGKRCLQGSADGKYLRNRLEAAFIAGYSLGYHLGYRNPAPTPAVSASVVTEEMVERAVDGFIAEGKKKIIVPESERSTFSRLLRAALTAALERAP